MKLLLFFCLILNSFFCFAQEKNIISFDENFPLAGALSFKKRTSEDNRVYRYKTEKNIKAYLNYSRVFLDVWQIKTALGYTNYRYNQDINNRLDNGSTRSYNWYIGPYYNFSNQGEDISSAYYFGFMMGFLYNKVQSSGIHHDRAYFAEIGKRFKLFNQITYAPSLSYEHIKEDSDFVPQYSSNALVLTFIKLDVFF